MNQSTSMISLEPAGDAALRGVQAALFEERARWSHRLDVCNQGSSICAVLGPQVRLRDFVEGLGSPSRLLIELSCDSILEGTAALAELGYRKVDAVDVHVASRSEIEAGTCAERGRDMLKDIGLELLGPDSPARDVIQFQEVQQKRGIVPVPGWVLRGHDGRTTTVVARHGSDIVGGGCTQRFLYRGRPAAVNFALCLTHDRSGEGLGSVLNSANFRNAVERGAEFVIGHFEQGPRLSREMCRKLGMREHGAASMLFAQKPPRARQEQH